MITHGSCDNGRQMLADFKALYGAPVGNNERYGGIRGAWLAAWSAWVEERCTAA
jgi:hypothetical protein